VALDELGDGLYIAGGAVRFYGFSLGTRMAVVRLEGDALLVYSPLFLTPGLRRDLEKLGRVRYVIAPNKIHNQTLADYAAAYPDAELWLAPGLPERRPDLSPAGVLGAEPLLAWSAELDQCLTAGNVFFSEALMLHRRSRTLMVADFVENIDAETASALARAAGRLFGMKTRPAPSPEFRLYTLDADAARQALERARAWHFDRIFLCHGALITEDAERVFASVCDELLAVAGRRGRASRWALPRLAARQ
jgi:hypothetical protein